MELRGLIAHIQLHLSVGIVMESEYKQKSQSQIGCLPDACQLDVFGP
jgi:hypothetical protein